MGKRRRNLADSSTATYQVDLYLEIDQALCDAVGDACKSSRPGETVINYINALVTGANSVYEVRWSLCLPDFMLLMWYTIPNLSVYRSPRLIHT